MGLEEYARTASQSARDEIIMKHLWLVRHIAGKMAAQLPPEVDAENLESSAMLGLVEAAERFDPTRGVDFKAFASLRIRGAIIDELRRNCPLPQEMLAKVQLVLKAQKVVTPPITVEKLSKQSGLTEEEVCDCLAAIPLTQMKSIEQFEDSANFFKSKSQSPDWRLELEDQTRLLSSAIQSLTERERLVVTLYYREDLRLKEIGRLLNLSESRVCRLLAAAQLAMREHVAAHS